MFIILRQFGAGGTGLDGGGGAPAAAVTGFVDSQQTQWAIPVRINATWVASVEVAAPVITTP